MSRVERVFVTLPAYNEEGAIAVLLERVLEMAAATHHPVTVIVVDDGSTDHTAEHVRAFADRGVLLVQHPGNQGLHEAVRTGMVQALQRAGDRDVVVTLDADNTHQPELIPSMVREIEQGADLVIASRFAPGGAMVGAPLLRNLYSGAAALVLRLRFGMPGVRDYTCGYRVYRVAILRHAFEKWGSEFVNVPGFSCMLDILVRLRSLNARVTEVPLVLRYDLKVGPSKLRVLRTIGNTMRLVLARNRD